MSRQITAVFYPITEKSYHKNKQNINNESPTKSNKPPQPNNRKQQPYLSSNPFTDKETIKMALGESHQQFSIVNNTSLGNIPSCKNSPAKGSKFYCPNAFCEQEYLQNLKPMRHVNTSFDEQVGEDNGTECEECMAFH